MTSSASNQTILITGGSGFIGTHVVKTFLEAGYKVRAAVRSSTSAAAVREALAPYAEQLSFSIVPDIVRNGAYDEAVKGVDGAIHVASPVVLTEGVDNEKDLLIPAIQGTTNLLQSIQEHAPQVKRVVITSSLASMLDLKKGLWPGHTYTEQDWNPETYEGAAAGDIVTAYTASKSLAERAAWDFVEQKKPNFSITTIAPPLVWGPIAHKVTSMASLPTTPTYFYNLMNGSLTQPPQTAFWAFIDVRDLALAHLKGFEVLGAAGERFLPSGGQYSFQMIVDILREKFPELRDLVPVGKPGSGLGAEVYGVDATKSESILGIKFRGLEELVVDTAKSLLDIKKSLSE